MRTETVTFYRNDDGRPRRVIRAETLVGEPAFGDGFESTLDRAMRLRPGRTYWISVQVNMDLAEASPWSWSMRSSVAGSPAVWKNPGDGYGTGCVDWERIADCYGDETYAGDLTFEVRTR